MQKYRNKGKVSTIVSLAMNPNSNVPQSARLYKIVFFENEIGIGVE